LHFFQSKYCFFLPVFGLQLSYFLAQHMLPLLQFIYCFFSLFIISCYIPCRFGQFIEF
jgi:hypothetical protein